MAGLIGIGHATETMGMNGLAQVNEMEKMREEEIQRQKLENKQNQMQLAGMGAGMGTEYGAGGMAIGALLGYAIGDL